VLESGALLDDGTLRELVSSDRRSDLFIEWASATDERLAGLNPPDFPRLAFPEQLAWHQETSAHLLAAISESPKTIVADTNGVVDAIVGERPEHPWRGEVPSQLLLLRRSIARLTAGVVRDQAGLVFAGSDEATWRRIRSEHESWFRVELDRAHRAGLSGENVRAVAAVMTDEFRGDRVQRMLVPQPRAALGYRHTNSKGVSYYLNSKTITLRGGRTQTVYYFSREPRPETAVSLPSDRTVNENPRNGFLTLRRKDEEDVVGVLTQRAPVSATTALRAATPHPTADALEVLRRSSEPRRDPEQLPPHLVSDLANSVSQVELEQLGFTLIWQAWRMGPDLIVLSPSDELLFVEVIGTLRAGVPRHLRPPAWRYALNEEFGVRLQDAAGLVMLVNLQEATWRAALTKDFEHFSPVGSADELASGARS
jgi:hypothetical protein